MTIADGNEQKPLPGKRMAMTANQRSAKSRGSFVALALLLVGIVFGVLGYLHLSRTQPPVELTVGAGPYRSDSYELMREAAEVVERQSTSLRIKVVPTPDSSSNISMLNQGRIDLATIRADTPVQNNIRVVAELFPDYFQIFARTDSGIFTIQDLIGKKIAIPNFGTDEFRTFWVIGDHYDLPVAQVKWIAMSFEKAGDEFIKGNIDAIFTVRSLRDRVLLDFFDDAKLKSLPVRFIEIDQAEAIAIKRPILHSANVPKGAYGGEVPTPARDTKTSTVQRVLVARDSVNNAAIAELTRILFEYRLDLTTRFALASAVQKPNEAGGLAMPMHEGSARYYNRDKPGFLQENTEMIGLVLTVAAMLGSALLALRSRLVSGQKNRMDSYNFVLLEIAEKIRLANGIDEVKLLKDDMFALLEKAVRALDSDEVTEEGFQSFSLLWESVREMLNDRRNDFPA